MEENSSGGGVAGEAVTGAEAGVRVEVEEGDKVREGGRQAPQEGDRMGGEGQQDVHEGSKEEGGKAEELHTLSPNCREEP